MTKSNFNCLCSNVSNSSSFLLSALGFERYWYWGTGYWPILAGIGVDHDISFTVKPDTDYRPPLARRSARPLALCRTVAHNGCKRRRALI